MDQTPQPLSVVVPTLNEADNMALLCSRIAENLESAGIPYEIVVVDDHSSDSTGHVVRQLAKRYPIRFFLKQGKRGKAYSLLEGFKHAAHDIVCMIDADLQYPPEAIASMYGQLRDHMVDLVITKRVEQQTSRLRQLSTKVFNLIFTRALFGIHYDTQSGLKLFRKSILDRMTLSPSPWSFDLEFIVRSLENDFKIIDVEIPFEERYAGVPKVHVISATLELAKASLKLRRATAVKRVRLNYKQNVALVRGMVVLLGIVGAFSFIAFGHTQSASALSLTTPLSSTTIGLQATPVSATVDTTVSLPTQSTALSALTPTNSSQSTATSNSTTSSSSNSGTAVTLSPLASTGGVQSNAPADSNAASTTSPLKTTTGNASAAAIISPTDSATASNSSSIAKAAGSSLSNVPVQVVFNPKVKPMSYNSSGVLSSRTGKVLIFIARSMLEVGGACIVLGLIRSRGQLRMKRVA